MPQLKKVRVSALPPPPVLRIEYDPALVPAGGAEVCASPAACVLDTGTKEAAGHSFHDKVRAHVLGADADGDGEAGSAAPAAGSSPSEPDTPLATAEDELVRWVPQLPPGAGKKKDKKQKKREHDPDNETPSEDATAWLYGEREDLYALLGLAHLRWQATDKHVQKAYKEAALKFHPDKCVQDPTDEEEKERAEDRFKLVQKALECLTDKQKRAEFDSTDVFDDDVPQQCDPADFYEVYAPVFERNARWSEKRGAPPLGGPDTPMRDVDAFYKWWYNFKSWREIPADEEFDVDAADGRDHKRWMQRQNAKLRQDRKKEEKARLMSLVESAEKNDPRVQARIQQQRDAKRKLKEDKERLIREKEEAEAAEAKAKADAEAKENEAKKEKAASAKKEKEKQKKQLQRARSSLRKCASEVDGFDEAAAETLIAELRAEQLVSLASEIEGLGEDRAGRAERLRSELEGVDAAAAERVKAAAQAAA